MRKSNYDKFPVVKLGGDESAAAEGWDEIAARLQSRIASEPKGRISMAVECYPGVNVPEVTAQLQARLNPTLVISAADALKPTDELAALIAPYTGGDDPLFGFLCDLTLPAFFDPEESARIKAQALEVESGLVLVVGMGASTLIQADILVYADLARWEIQQRFRRGLEGHLSKLEPESSVAAKYKRAYFVDWRVADRWKADFMEKWDFLLDTHQDANPKLVEGSAFRSGLKSLTQRPFRVVPFFDPAPWGGQWMKEVCDLDRETPNFGWCFDCVPEENSLLLQFGRVVVEVPALDLVLYQPRALLGEEVYQRFGAEFPIRFDFLDTIDGGNLSFQVHPLTEYIRHHFGMAYTQDESYYLLDAKPDACVYLGLTENVNPDEMRADLELAQKEGKAFPISKYANRWPARKHDHFLIPAGTVHCSGTDSMVLEISATPYIFTFKLWDWGRMGLDGKPRPINIERGVANIQWERTTDWVKNNLIAKPELINSGEGWVEELTGLHESEFIETRRHWFTGPVTHHTGSTVNVLNLVEGEEVVVHSPTGAFKDFVIHYAETFIIPAEVGPYQIIPSGTVKCPRYGTIKATVRATDRCR